MSILVLFVYASISSSRDGFATNRKIVSEICPSVIDETEKVELFFFECLVAFCT